MSLFKDAALPGFSGTGLSSAVSWSSVGVCPGAQAAKAKRAKEETPLFVSALASSGVRATSEALLLRALVDSRDVLMLLDTKSCGKDTYVRVQVMCQDNYEWVKHSVEGKPFFS